MFSLRMGRSLTNYSGGVLMSEFLWEKRKIKRGVSRFVVRVIIKIISICIHMRELFEYFGLLLRRVSSGKSAVFLVQLGDIFD